MIDGLIEFTHKLVKNPARGHKVGKTRHHSEGIYVRTPYSP